MNEQKGNIEQVVGIRARVKAAYEGLYQLLVEELARLEAGRLYQIPQQDEWTVMENLAHIVEFMPYWAGEIRQLVAQPGRKFGRTKEDPDRINAISQHSKDSLEQAKADLPGSYALLDDTLAGLKDGDLQLTGVHSKFGERKLELFIEDFVTKHLEDHLDQLRATLNQVR